jgi:hypothetical protein
MGLLESLSGRRSALGATYHVVMMITIVQRRRAVVSLSSLVYRRPGPALTAYSSRPKPQDRQWTDWNCPLRQEPVGEGSSVGNKRIHLLEGGSRQAVRARLVIDDASAWPVFIRGFSAYKPCPVQGARVGPKGWEAVAARSF